MAAALSSPVYSGYSWQEKSSTCWQTALQNKSYSGDKKEVVNDLAKEINITEYYSELLPADKLERFEKIYEDNSSLGSVIYIGDGINDTPVLSRADVGISMGCKGSDIAIETSDAVIMGDDLIKVSQVINVAKKTVKISKQNIFIALSIKLLIMILSV